MSKIYASFSDPSLAEKAAGALLDYGVHTEDLSVIRRGSDADFKNWESGNQTSTYSAGSAGTSDFDRAIQGDPAYTSGQVTDPSDPNYIYENPPSDAGMNDPQFRAAERTSTSDYSENRMNMEDRESSDVEASAKTGISTTTGADSAAGAGKGAAVGLGVGILAALASVFVPGFGLILGGSALATAIGGAIATTGAGAVAGAVTGYLKDQGVDTTIATDYERTINEGGALIEVNVPSGDVDEATAREVLAKYGAANVGSYAGKGYVA